MLLTLCRYDSLTGVPACQRTVSFEKGSVLFNIGALYTQIGARQDRSTVEGIDRAIENFQRAAGAFRYLCDNFSNAPSMDMQSSTLDMLIQLMLVSASFKSHSLFHQRTTVSFPIQNLPFFVTVVNLALHNN